jgi:hypothetical protein
MALAAPLENTYVETEVKPFVERQVGIHVELRDGLSRLLAACNKKQKGPPPALPDELRSVSTRLERNQRQASDAEKLADNAVGSYLADIKQRKNRRCGALSLLNSDRAGSEKAQICAALESEQQSADLLLQQLARYKETSKARYAVFRDLLQAEARGCTRPGFTENLLSVYEKNNLVAETGVTEMFSVATGKLRESYKAATPESK